MNKKKSLAKKVKRKNKGRKVVHVPRQQSPLEMMPAWDTIRHMSNGVGTSIADTSNTFREILSNGHTAVIIAASEDRKKWIGEFRKGLLEVKEKYKTLVDQHVGRAGETTSPEDYALALKIHSEYVTFFEQITSFFVESMGTIDGWTTTPTEEDKVNV